MRFACDSHVFLTHFTIGRQCVFPNRVRFACVSHAFLTHNDSALIAEFHIKTSNDAVHSHRFGGGGGIIFQFEIGQAGRSGDFFESKFLLGSQKLPRIFSCFGNLMGFPHTRLSVLLYGWFISFTAWQSHERSWL